MNRALIRSTVLQLISQPVRAGVLLGCIVLPLFQIIVEPEPRIGNGWWSMFLGVVAAAGVIGLEWTTGAIALMFTRPISRMGYVASRACGALLLATAAATGSTLAEIAIVLVRGGEITFAGAMITLADRLLSVGGVSIVVASFSAMTSSLGDLVIWVGTNIVAVSLDAASQSASIPWLGSLARGLFHVVRPRLDLYQILGSTRVPWSEVTAYAATLLLALSIGVAVINRREVTYAGE